MTEYVQGVIEARSTLHVPVDVTAQELEEQETTAHFMIVGSLGFSLVSFVLVDSDLPEPHGWTHRAIVSK